MTADDMQDLICRLIPYMEDIEHDNAYKPGAVRKLLCEMNAAIADDILSLVCEICGEPAGAGGALCPVHLREAGIE